MKNALTPDEIEMVVKVTDEACQELGCDAAPALLGFANKGERRYQTLLAVALDQTTR